MQQALSARARRSIASAMDHLRRRDWAAAMNLGQGLVAREPALAEGPMILASASQQAGDLTAMEGHGARAVHLAPDRLDARLLWAEALSCAGRVGDALAELGRVEDRAGSDYAAWDRLTVLYTQLGRHRAAHRCACRLAARSPGLAGAALRKASTALAVGLLEEAEDLLERVVAADPAQVDAHYNLAVLRRQTTDRNHIQLFEERLRGTPRGNPGETPLCFALAKELEDVGRHGEAFAYLERGAAARRWRLSYDVRADVASVDRIIATFDRAWWRRTDPGPEVSGPLFVLGLPRGGTTLVDRILSSLEGVASLGEVNDLAYTVMRAGGPVSGKGELIARAAEADMAALGEGYWRALRGYGEAAAYLIDKTPANYLYLGLIMKALPGARIIHLGRHPMAGGYALYKTLFRMGYPFSYDLGDIAAYMLAQRRLMAHWHDLAPDRILDVHYEALVDDQETESRRLVAYCGLTWDPAALAFYKNSGATATASAAQVRQPIYRHARDLWRVYESQLAPLAEALAEGGAL